MRTAQVMSFPTHVRTKLQAAIKNQLEQLNADTTLWAKCMQNYAYPLADLINPTVTISDESAKAFAAMYVLHANAGPITFMDHIQFATYINTNR